MMTLKTVDRANKGHGKNYELIEFIRHHIYLSCLSLNNSNPSVRIKKIAVPFQSQLRDQDQKKVCYIVDLDISATDQATKCLPNYDVLCICSP